MCAQDAYARFLSAEPGRVPRPRQERRQLNAEEAERLWQAWPSFGSEVEPLHVWMGWTQQELWNYEKRGKLPK